MKLNKILFQDVIIYRVSEPGAMGPSGTITCFSKDGESFTLDYTSAETPWEEIKKCFPAIDGCRFDGPTKQEEPFINLIVIGRRLDDESTHVNEGWKHMWLDFGNHLVCREEYYELKNIFCDMDYCEITFDWDKRLREIKFAERLDEINDIITKVKEPGK